MKSIIELRKLLAAGTKGPWGLGDGYEQSERGNYIYGGGGAIVAAEQDGTDCVLSTADAYLIAAAINSLPDLLAIAEGVANGETYAVGGNCSGCNEGHISHNRHAVNCTVMLARTLAGE